MEITPDFPDVSFEKVRNSGEYQERLASSRLFKPLPEALGTKPKNFALALAENVVIFKLTVRI